MKTYEVIVIGSGGGTKITSTLLKLGKKFALVEKSKGGGTCLNRGCIPSKLFIHPGHQVKNIKTIDRLNISAKVEDVDFASIVSGINSYTDSVAEKVDNKYFSLKEADYYKGHARFVSDKVIEVNGEQITAEKIIIATGSRPHIPEVPGLVHTPFMTSNEALRNKKIPKRLIVLGGGYIATELGGAYANYGTEVSFVLRSSFLRKIDSELHAIFENEFPKGKNVYYNSKIFSANYEDQKFYLTLEDEQGEQTLEAEELLVCTGILPNADQIGLENTAIKTSPKGFIEVNEYLETSVPGVYAIGDVVGNYLFRHSVNFEAEYWLQANYLGEKQAINYSPMPSAIFTDPEIASVGLTEEEAKEQGINCVIGKGKYTSITMSQARGHKVGLVKLIFNTQNKKLIGAHIIGDEASTMFQELVLAATHQLTAEDMYKQVYIHPAYPEVVRGAVRDALKQMDEKYRLLF